MTDAFDEELEADDRFERRVFWRQLAIILLVAVLVVLRVILV